MKVDVSSEIVIDRPVGVVSEYAANPDNAPAWNKNIKSVEWRTAPPFRAGSQIAFVAQFLGKRLAYTYEIIDFVAGERLIMRTAEGPFLMETTYTCVATADGRTLMALRNRGIPTRGGGGKGP